MKVSVDTLKHHPINREIYNLSSIDELIESIKRVGLLQPLTVDQHNQVVSGNRRFEAIKRLGWKKVEVNRITVKNGDDILLLIHFNKQRVKSVKEILSEYDHLRRYYQENKGSKGDVKGIREKVGNDIQVSDGNLARILFVRKHKPEMIELIDKGVLSVNQSYLMVQRSQKEEQSRNHKSDESNEVINGDEFRFYQKSSDNMSEVSDDSIDCIFTSPSYYSLRRYSNDDIMGQEESSEQYIDNLVKHLGDTHRVLKRTGSFYLNLGDTYVNGSLQNIPHRVCIKLQEKYGFILRNAIVWKKVNPLPSSVKNRLSTSYEMIFHLVKSLDYHYVPVYTKLSDKTKPSHPPRHRSSKDVEIKSISPYIPSDKGKILQDYFDFDIIQTAVSNQKVKNIVEHPAQFPEMVVYLNLLPTCVFPFEDSPNYSPIVCDPFCGSLTTYRVVQKINEEYGTKLRYVGYDIKRYF